MMKKKGIVPVQAKQKLYEQFINRLLILLLTGIATGGCLLAAFDYVLNAQIPERSPFVIGFFALVSLVCLVYWLMTFLKAKGVEGLRGLALFALTISVISSGMGVYDVVVNQRNLGTYFLGENITIKDKKATAETLIEYLELWRHTPNYSLVYISDDVFYATVYNSEGESVTQLTSTYEDEVEGAENITICLADGTAVVVDEESIGRRKDADNLAYVVNALKWVTSGKASIERASVSDTLIEKNIAPPDTFPGTEYAIIIDGLDNMRNFFAELIGLEGATSMLSGLVGTDVALIYNVFLSDGKIAVSSAIYMNNESSLLWYIDGYTEVYDWTLGSYDWYDYDYADSEQNELMLEETMYNVTSMLDRFGLDVGLDWDDSETGGSSDSDDAYNEDHGDHYHDANGNIHYYQDADIGDGEDK